MWIVKIIKPMEKSLCSVYPKDYFPRKFAYKKEALELVQIVKDNGGKATALKGK